MLTLLVMARLTEWPAIRWGGLKEITFLSRPYTRPNLKIVKVTFISLPYTMTPIYTITFKTKNQFSNFFFRLELNYLWLTYPQIFENILK